MFISRVGSDRVEKFFSTIRGGSGGVNCDPTRSVRIDLTRVMKCSVFFL